ncbi:MAG: hypothetical protein BWY57_02594 [Betaproteobacteria bacterium ADurb.Bin341]|nr:MAG: hypothetical protein BWY57_02594 [Betaproteobacteria bacterium ADurb.Bin341]
MRALTAINLVADLPFGVIHQNLALAALDKDHKCRHQNNQGADKERRQRVHGAGTYQFKQTANGIRQTRRNPGENDDRNAIAQAALGHLLTQPHQEHRSRQQGRGRHHAEHEPRLRDQTGLAFKRNGNANPLKQGQEHRSVAGVLRNLAPPGFAFFFQRFQLRAGHRHQLHDDRGRNVGHDPQGEDGKARQRAPGEHVEHAQDTALLGIEEFSKHIGIDARHRDMRADAIDDQSTQQEPKPALQISELVALAYLSAIRHQSHLSFIRKRNRLPLQSLPWRPSLRQPPSVQPSC